ncbi:MAG: polysaccharide deacetylase family protein, partial [Bacteroidota bacterium]
MYAVKTPQIIQRLFPNLLWRFPSKEKVLYLTFDDGPIPEVTPWVLDTLQQFDAKATFFCVGDNVQKHPKIFERLLSEKHSVGNHTFHHLDGWKNKKDVYLSDIKKCAKSLNSNLFRPPYGRLKPQ